MFWLLDTGPVVALLDDHDDKHERVSLAFGWLLAHGAFATTMPIVAEAMYLLQEIPRAQDALVRLLMSSRSFIHPSHEESDLLGAIEFMRKYADLPMDYADASLVHLSRLSGIRTVFTLDERGFRVFQPAPRVHFELVLDQF